MDLMHDENYGVPTSVASKKDNASSLGQTWKKDNARKVGLKPSPYSNANTASTLKLTEEFTMRKNPYLKP